MKNNLSSASVGSESPNKTTRQATHTPTPWKWWTPKSGRPKNYDLARLISGASDQNGNTIFCLYGGSGKLALGTSPIDIANAEFLLYACNNIERITQERDQLKAQRDELLSACNSAERELEEGVMPGVVAQYLRAAIRERY